MPMVALVTGGGQGLGRAIARRLARDGARVAIAQRASGPLTRTAAEIEAAGGVALAVPADVAAPEQVARLVETVRDAFGPIEILVNNAGFNRRRATFTEIDLASWQEVLAADLTGPFLCARAVAPEMIARGWGRIVNVGAIQAWMPLPGNAAYAAAKSGLVGLTRSMAVDLTAHGVVVNAIAPGPVDPEAEDAPRDGDDWPTLLGRRGLPREVAALAAFLASDDCTFVVGQTIVCDGGRQFSRKPERD
jgi:NAD(P)-dependent dehydrogenase (short-subunit alcohol dehydrogenase family)